MKTVLRIVFYQPRGLVILYVTLSLPSKPSCPIICVAVGETVHHKAKQIEGTHGAPVRNGDVLVPGYDVEGKLWTVHSQSIEWGPAV